MVWRCGRRVRRRARCSTNTWRCSRKAARFPGDRGAKRSPRGRGTPTAGPCPSWTPRCRRCSRPTRHSRKRGSPRTSSFSPRSCSRCAAPAARAAPPDTHALSDLPMRRFPPFAALLLFAAAANAQTTAADTVPGVAAPIARPATDSLYRRARRLVAEGNGVAGRALVDSLLRAADPAMPAYGDALYWRGALAPTAAEAERDYRRVIVEYPLAYYADDALLAIAELEQARGDRASALAHLQRFVREHPASQGRGVAALGAARLAFEQRDAKLACSLIAAARASASPTDVELRNQIEYYGRQCPATSVASEAQAAPPVSAPVASAPVASAPVASAPVAPPTVTRT